MSEQFGEPSQSKELMGIDHQLLASDTRFCLRWKMEFRSFADDLMGFHRCARTELQYPAPVHPSWCSPQLQFLLENQCVKFIMGNYKSPVQREALPDRGQRTLQ